MNFAEVRPQEPELIDEIRRRCAAVEERGDFVRGSVVSEFEQAWAGYCGSPHAVAVGNGTDAITLTIRALGLRPGDEVIVPASSFIATAEGVVLAGATPVFCDVDPTTGNLTGKTVEAVLTEKTRAVIAVHLYGRMVDMAPLMQVCTPRQIIVIEDAAQAHGATYSGRRAGSLAGVGTFSFYPTKNLGAHGDAGAIVTHSASLARRIRALADHGPLCGATNSRMDSLQAAVLLAKLPYLDGWNERRRAIAARYNAQIEAIPPQLDPDAVHHLYVVETHEPAGFRAQLSAAGIPTAVHYPVPLHKSPLAILQPGGSVILPVAEARARRIVSLPMHPYLTDDDIDRVCEAAL